MGNLKNKILQINAHYNNLQLFGWIIIPEHAPSSSEHQYIYLNQRFVKDKLLSHAIKEAYSEQLPPGKQALYCLYLSLPMEEFDVNVHPTKLEVRFKEPRVIHDFLMLTIRDALQVPIKMITPQGYKIPLPMPTNLEPTTNKLLSILDNRLLLMEEDNQLVVIDALKLKNAILQ
jgi:DNA mismatch repair ATPase MutL